MDAMKVKSGRPMMRARIDRKSTRLNSSHANISPLPLHDALPICDDADHHRHEGRLDEADQEGVEAHRSPEALEEDVGADAAIDPGGQAAAHQRRNGRDEGQERQADDEGQDRSEEHTSELQSRQYLPSSPTRRSSDLR